MRLHETKLHVCNIIFASFINLSKQNATQNSYKVHQPAQISQNHRFCFSKRVLLRTFFQGLFNGRQQTESAVAPLPPCQLKQGFTRTFPRNQDVVVKLKYELIFITFQCFFNFLADPKPICFTQMIPPTFGSFSFFQASL